MEDAPKTEPQYNRWDLILGYCKENSYKIMQTVPERIVLMLFREAAGVRRVTIRFEEPRTFLTVNISPLEKIPPQSLSEAYRIVNDVNVMLNYGSVRLDHKDGEVTFTAGLDYGEEISDNDFKQLLDNTFSVSLMSANQAFTPQLLALLQRPEEQEDKDSDEAGGGASSKELGALKDACAHQ